MTVLITRGWRRLTAVFTAVALAVGAGTLASAQDQPNDAVAPPTLVRFWSDDLITDTWDLHIERGSEGGVDFALDSGTPLRSAMAGVVEIEKTDDPAELWEIHVKDPETGWVSSYLHVKEFLVEDGASVNIGDPIALSGGAADDPGVGPSTGAHLHWHLIDPQGVRQDPMPRSIHEDEWDGGQQTPKPSDPPQPSQPPADDWPNTKFAWDFLVKQDGFEPHIVAGFLGNFMVETGTDNLDPTTEQTDGGPGRGIAQWEEGARFDQLVEFAKQKNTHWSDLQTQLEFVIHEINNDEQEAWAEIQKAKDPEEAAKLVSEYYLRPGIPNDEERVEKANAVFQKYAGKGDDDPTAQPSEPGSGAPNPEPSGTATDSGTPEPTATVTDKQTVSPEPQPTVTVTETASPEPQPTVTTTETQTVSPEPESTQSQSSAPGADGPAPKSGDKKGQRPGLPKTGV